MWWRFWYLWNLSALPGRVWATTTFNVPSLSRRQRAPHLDMQRQRRRRQLLQDQSFAISPDYMTTSRAKSGSTSTATATVGPAPWDGLQPMKKTFMGEALSCRRVSTKISWNVTEHDDHYASWEYQGFRFSLRKMSKWLFCVTLDHSLWWGNVFGHICLS